MTTRTCSSDLSEGLGQLAAYVGAEEGVAFEMDNKLIWASMCTGYDGTIQGLAEKTERSKFTVTSYPSGKVTLRDWTHTYIAPLPPSVHPYIYPLRLAPDMSSGDAAIYFEVFYKGNKVAFRAYNGLFLARVYRGYHTIEAAKQIADESCCFRPMIGDMCSPDFRILRASLNDDMSADKCNPCILQSKATSEKKRVARDQPLVVKRERITNRSYKPKSHTFCMTWEADVTDRIAWKNLWGLGLAISGTVRIRGMRLTLKYAEDNEKVVSVSRRICETHAKEVVIPPKSVCTASFLVNKKDNAVLILNATILKELSNGYAMILHQPCAWTGLVFNNIHLVVEMKPIWNPCNIL